MKLRDPRAPVDKDGRADSAVYINGDRVEVAADGTFEHPAITRAWAEGYAERNDATLSEVLIEESDSDETEPSGDDVCGAEMSDGSICERPADECPYH